LPHCVRASSSCDLATSTLSHKRLKQASGNQHVQR
jgi:hypothetical protein